MENQKRKKKIIKVTLIGSIGNLLLLFFKFAAGFLGRSSAMIADAVHSLSDFVTDVIVLLFVNISSKPKDESHDYGHGKFETLATAIIGIVLTAVGVGLCWQGISKIYGYYFQNEILNSPGYIALFAAIISIIIKEILYWITLKAGKNMNSQVVIANAWHHRSDVFSSLGTTLGLAGAILLGESWRILDPLAAVIVSIFIIKISFKLIMPALNELLEKSLPQDIEDEIISIIQQIPNVYDPHNLRTRRIGNTYAIELHIRVDGSMNVNDSHLLTLKIEEKLREHFGANTHIMLHVEPLKTS